jgi:glycerate 2-kinase
MHRNEKNILTSLIGLRNHCRYIFVAGIKAADPYRAVQNCLSYNAPQLKILLSPNKPETHRTGNWSKLHLIAFGKAACAMAEAARDVIPSPLLVPPSIAVTNYENVLTHKDIEVIGASHPLPDEAGLAAAKKIIAKAKSAQKDELVLVMISGGGSALIPYPAAEITLQEKIATTDLLLASGATINEINCVRKHLSQIKGGGLAKMTAPADLHAFILSDVLGDDLSAIASGPCVPDETTYRDAISVLTSKKIWNKTPVAVRNHLEQGKFANVPETPKKDDPAFLKASHTLIGSNAISVNAIQSAAQELGYQSQIYRNGLVGEAKVEAEKLVVFAKKLIDDGISKPIALLAGGETTVTVHGKGLGGRNQEMALAFAIAAKQHYLSGSWAFLSGGTDGRDGPTDAAGAIVDQESIKRMRDSAIIPEQMLRNNDSYNALRYSGDLLMTGATGTNVADLQVLLIHP